MVELVPILIGFSRFGTGYPPFQLLILLPGAFIALGLLVAGMKCLEQKG